MALPPADHDDEVIAALVTEREHDFTHALEHFDTANKRSPSANTYYDLAELYRRLDMIEKALEAYRKYLDLAPNATDRAAVRRAIGELEHGPQLVHVATTDLDSGSYFLDGAPLALDPSGKLRAPAGWHG